VDLDAGTITVAQGRVVVGGATVTGAPKSTRSARTLPMPRDVLTVLKAFKTRQAEEHLALGGNWPDTGLVAVNADGSPIRPETYSKAFAGHCVRRGCRQSGYMTSGTPPPRCCSTAAPRHPRLPNGWARPGDHAAGLPCL